MTPPDDRWLQTPLAQWVWETRYAWRHNDKLLDRSIEDSWRRVARSAAAVETVNREQWAERFYRLLQGFKFLPGGRILAGAGTGQQLTLFNCFVMGPLQDDEAAMRAALQQAQLTIQAGGGIGYDFSGLPPGRVVPAMRRWDDMCSAMLSGGARRGAMMASLRCDHPDIEGFINAKHEAGTLSHFNLSVLVSDAFMHAVDTDSDWPLVFPPNAEDRSVAGRICRTVAARGLWRKIMQAAYDSAEPGVLFVDCINACNNLAYRERISATNPCGEVPLPPFGACNLGSVNLTGFIVDAFTPRARFDTKALAEATHTATRLLDNVIDCSDFPLPEHLTEARGSRRIGLGITGLADALIMLGLCYRDESARCQAARVMKTICYQAYRSSIELAREKGSFPFFDKQAYLQGRFIARLPRDIRIDIETRGIRNSHLTAIAPAGTISLLANNLSSGIEPVFDYRQSRRVRNAAGGYDCFDVDDYAFSYWRRLKGDSEKLPAQFVTAHQIEPRLHLLMQAALQPYVDSAISKTINIPGDYPYTDFQQLYREAWQLGLKGCTVFRASPARGCVLRSADEGS